MRRFLVVCSVIALALLTARLRVAQARPPRPPAARVSAADLEQRVPSWTVVGWGETLNDAHQAALEKAQRELRDYLARQDPPIHWQPSQAYIDAHLVKERPQEIKDFPDPVGRMYQRTLRLEIEPRQYREIREFDRQERVQERQLLLAKALAGVLAVLAAVTFYFRLDEATKGYYTLRLGLAAFGLVVVVGAVLLLVA